VSTWGLIGPRQAKGGTVFRTYTIEEISYGYVKNLYDVTARTEEEARRKFGKGQARLVDKGEFVGTDGEIEVEE